MLAPARTLAAVSIAFAGAVQQLMKAEGERWGSMPWLETKTWQLASWMVAEMEKTMVHTDSATFGMKVDLPNDSS